MAVNSGRLNAGRWILAACVGCALLTTAFVRFPGAPPRETVTESREVLHYRRLQRRTADVTRRWAALARRDAALAALPARTAGDLNAPQLVPDTQLPAASHAVVARTVARQWKGLGIDSALVPVVVVVLVDTASRPVGGSAGGGEMSITYRLAASDGTAEHERCVAIVGLHSARLVRPGAHRRLAELLAPSARRASAVLGPCAFQARFGIAGPGIDAWLRARSYDFAASPSWEPGIGPAAEGDDAMSFDAMRPAKAAGAAWFLSPDARGCVAGDLARCELTLVAAPSSRTRALAGGLFMPPSSADPHWGGLTSGYLSDLATALGPVRFAAFWRSELPPDGALNAVANVPLNVWTQRWALSMIGPLRTGPAPRASEVLRAVMLAACCLAIAAAAWGRRQVR